MHTTHGIEHITGAQTHALLAQLVREDVEQHFRIGAGVDVTQIRREQLLLELVGVGQVAVVRQRDAVRRVDIERL